MKYSGIPYEALDSQGYEYVRDAQIIGELPWELRKQACRDAVGPLSTLIARPLTHPIFFGAPIYEAFGMRRADAKRHDQAALLLKLGCDIPLRLCT